MRYYILDEIVDPVSKESLVVEATESLRRDGPTPRKCRVWCGYRGTDPAAIAPSTCAECGQLWIEEGVLTSRRNRYPIHRGIPRLLVSREDGAPSAPQLSAEVQESFGYEWEAFDHVLPEYDAEAANYFRLLGPSPFDGVIVDAGCGMGRWAMFAAQSVGDRLFAVDFSRAIDRAAARLAPFPRAHCLQADLAFLPLRDSLVDVTYCLGVLHHLVRPDDGLRELARVTRRSGGILLYLYYALDNRPVFYRWLLAVVTVVRRVTSRLPKRMMHAIAILVGVAVYWPLARVAATLGRLFGPGGSSLIPLHHYASHSLRFMIADAFDRFGTPVEFRYTRQEIREWLTSYGMEATFSDTSPYWVALAKVAPKPLSLPG
jgi:SAM-dependent methyltransferase/uncharacterized protein YbaR (Trm112 family)